MPAVVAEFSSRPGYSGAIGTTYLQFRPTIVAELGAFAVLVLAIRADHQSIEWFKSFAVPVLKIYSKVEPRNFEDLGIFLF